MTNPKLNTYDTTSKKPDYVVTGASIVAVVGLVATGWVVWYTVDQDDALLLYCSIGAWAILAPLWFWYEYFMLYRRYGRAGTIELFKYGQQVAGSIWAGVLAALIAFAATQPWKGSDEVMISAQTGASTLQSSVLIQLRNSQRTGFTTAELANKLGLSQELVSAVLSDLKATKRVVLDKKSNAWILTN